MFLTGAGPINQRGGRRLWRVWHSSEVFIKEQISNQWLQLIRISYWDITVRLSHATCSLKTKARLKTDDVYTSVKTNAWRWRNAGTNPAGEEMCFSWVHSRRQNIMTWSKNVLQSEQFTWEIAMACNYIKLQYRDRVSSKQTIQGHAQCWQTLRHRNAPLTA